MKWRGVFFGLNYHYCSKAKLKGCINDTKELSSVLTSILGPGKVNLYTDDLSQNNTSYNGIINILYDLTLEVNREKYDLVIVHYSGHGSSVVDLNGDEKDGYDEAICPSDYASAGLIKDDMLNYILSGIFVQTKLITIFDSCHSGSVLDLKYLWNLDTKKPIVNNKADHTNPNCKIILISGCRDNQTSADATNPITKQPQGALTATLGNVLKENPSLFFNILELVKVINLKLKNQFTQTPLVTSNYNINTLC